MAECGCDKPTTLPMIVDALLFSAGNTCGDCGASVLIEMEATNA